MKYRNVNPKFHETKHPHPDQVASEALGSLLVVLRAENEKSSSRMLALLIPRRCSFSWMAARSALLGARIVTFSWS